MDATFDPQWSADWLWGLPMIVITVVIHVFGLILINEMARRIHRPGTGRRDAAILFTLVMGAVTLAAAVLHAVEATAWALLYRGLGALPDARAAMLFSLNAITSYGHANLELDTPWRLLGALEALNGILLFGLTTAFMFATIQRIRPLDRMGPVHRPVTGPAEHDG